MPFRNTGGVTTMTIRGFIGKSGGNFVCQKVKEVYMGFRDLQSFNLAMLAKKVWRLLREPESLCAQVLRARYYPDGKLLNARMKGGSSYTWQSVLAGLYCFKLGYI